MKKNILIIGSSSGIGNAAVKHFVNLKFNVVGISRRKVGIKKKNFKHISFDLNNFDLYDQLFESIYKQFGKIDYLLFAAGIQFVRPSSIISKKDIDNIVGLNLNSPILFSKFITMKKYFRNGGSVVFVSSVIAHRPSAGQILYGSSKSGILNFVKSLALEVSKNKINVNSISPGMINGPMLKKYSKSIPKEIFNPIIEKHPLGLGNFKDVINVVNFLFSEKSKWITGTDIVADGGYSI